MISQATVALAAALAALAIGWPGAALAQSAYTTGAAAANAAAGYPSPYGRGIYAYAPGYFSTAPAQSRRHWRRR